MFQVFSPHYVFQPQAPPPHLLPQRRPPSHSPDLCFDDLNWTQPEPPPGLSCLNTCQNQNQFSPDEAHYGGGTHTVPPGPGPEAWGPLELTPTQMQRPWLGPGSGGAAPGGWSSAELGPAFAGAADFNACFFPDGSLDAARSFCSPTTPGPSPHDPQTPSGDQNHETDTRPSQTEPTRHLAAGGSRPGFSAVGGAGAAPSPSLPAGRGWGGERGGDGQPDWTWMKTSEHAKALGSRLLCTVCQRDFRSLPALNGHMRSHSGGRSAAWTTKGGAEPGPLLRRSRGPIQNPARAPSVSMVMPVSVPVRSGGGAVLYRSLMRPEDGGGRHYTPPPLLRPLRAGPGLYCSLAAGGQRRDPVAMETVTTGSNKPRINVGRGFQAEIPPLRARVRARADAQGALLLWSPRDELETPANRRRVEALLAAARSGVVPGGGADPEYALRVLSECGGDFLLTLEKLLSTPDDTGVRWSAAETRLAVKSLQLSNKDFSGVQRAVRTKSLAQCVEFYYLWKRKPSARGGTPAGLTVTLPDPNGRRSSRSHDAP